MIRLALSSLALMTLASLSAAQVVEVRAGQHDDFTRLVFALPEGADWQLEPQPEENAYRLALTGTSAEFGLQGALDRVDRGRIAQITAQPGQSAVTIAMSCQCVAEPSLIGRNMLIIDITDSDTGLVAESAGPMPSADPSPLEEVHAAADHAAADHAAAEPTAAPEPADHPEEGHGDNRDDVIEAADAADLARIRTDGRPGIGPGKAADPLMPGVPLVHSADAGLHGAADPEEMPLHVAPKPVSVGEQIIADLAAAATQGLLDPAIQKASPLTLRPEPEPELGPSAGHDLAHQLVEGLAGLDHEAVGAGRIAVGAVNCVSEKRLRVADWGIPDDDVFEALSETRSAVFGEFDRIDGDALTDHMRKLIYYGFGVELRAASELASETADPVLTALSYLVDLQDDPTDVFARQSECEGAAALWAVMDMTNLPLGRSINTGAILRSFEALPKGLRDHIGPTLADKLAEFGERDTARDLLRRLQRSAGEETDRIALERAKLDVQEGKPDSAAQTLRDLALTPGPDSIAAIKAAADLAEQTGDRVPAVLVELAAAYATELRNTDDGPDLWAAHLRMLLVNGAFDEAFVVLENSKGIPEQLAHDMGDHMLEALLPSEDEVSFLKYAFRLDATGHRTTQPELDLAVARRMLDLGLSEAVLERLDRIDIDESTQEVRLLRARAYLQLSQPEEAEGYLLGLQGEEPEQLRAEIRSLMGDHEFAQSAFARVGQSDAALKAAWLSGNWQDVAQAEDAALSATADLVQAPQTIVDPADLSLQAAEQLASESADARATLRSLLEATQVVTE